MFSHFLRKLWPFATEAAGRTVRAAGRRWHLAPEAVALFGPEGPDLDRWVADGSAVVVKTGPHRTVYRVALPGGVVFVKHCRVNGPRALAREVVRPPKARLEFENALALARRGVPAVVPLAWGRPDSWRPGESFLVTRELAGVVPFAEFADRSAPDPAVRRLLARALGHFLAKLHDAGVAHPDPHPGNLFVEFPASRVPRFRLLDLHAVRVGRPLGWAESRANLALYNRWFQVRASPADRLRFWHAYRRSRRGLPTVSPETEAEQARGVERATAESNLRFWRGRMLRYTGRHRDYRRVKAGAVRGLAVRDLPAEFVAEVLADPDAVFAQPGVRVLKDSPAGTVAELAIPTPAGPMAVVFKRVTGPRLLDRLKNLLRPSAVVRSWVAGHTLRDRWLPTPKPLLVLHRHRAGLPAEGYLLAEKVPDAVGLREAVQSLAGRPDAKAVLRAWMDRLARVVRAMHDRGVSHRDLKAANVLMSGMADPATAVPVLVDLVGVWVLHRPVPFHLRAKELGRLAASFLNSPLVTHGERLRFLRTYLFAGEWLEPERRAARFGAGWKNWWKAVSRAVAAKVAKNHRSGRPLF